MKRAVIFAHYDPNDIIEDYVISYITGLRLIATSIIFVSTANLDESEKAKLKGVCEEVIVRENEGYDFKSWGVAIQNFGRPFLEQYDELVLCNDSCYASNEALLRMFELMQMRNVDFWGVTDSHDYSYHLHSYFVVFRSRVLTSQTFWDFYTAMGIESNKVDIVKKYEVGLTSALTKEGFSCDVYIRYSNTLLFWLASLAKVNVLSHELIRRFIHRSIPGSLKSGAKRRSARKWLDIFWIFLNPLNVNTTLFDWRRLIRKGSPFLKTTVLKLNVYKDARIGEWYRLALDHGFQVENIQNHLDRLQKVSVEK